MNADFVGYNFLISHQFLDSIFIYYYYFFFPKEKRCWSDIPRCQSITYDRWRLCLDCDWTSFRGNKCSRRNNRFKISQFDERSCSYSWQHVSNRREYHRCRKKMLFKCISRNGQDYDLYINKIIKRPLDSWSECS